MKCLKDYKDMNKMMAYKKRCRERYYRKTQYAKNYMNPWTEKEVELVMRHDMTDGELSKLIGRSVMSIQTMRWRENKRRRDEQSK